MSNLTITPAAARRAREEAEQRLAMAFDAKASAAERLAKLEAKTSTHPGVLAVACADVDKAKALFAAAQAALDEAAKVERDGSAWKAGRK